jgi:hypothetical protein
MAYLVQMEMAGRVLQAQSLELLQPILVAVAVRHI